MLQYYSFEVRRSALAALSGSKSTGPSRCTTWRHIGRHVKYTQGRTEIIAMLLSGGATANLQNKVRLSIATMAEPGVTTYGYGQGTG